jgi:uncharacterized protein YndB with AHSA1/START domain
MPQSITVQTLVKAPIDKVWDYWTSPQHVPGWSFASDDWEAYGAENDLRAGGRFKTTMAAKDKSFSFEFSGVNTAVKAPTLLEYKLDDERKVKVEFIDTPDGVKIVETFEAETANPVEMQRDGWQAFLENFKKYAESR